MEKHHQREKPPAQGRIVQEIAGDGLTEERQGVEPLRGGDGHELRQLIPDQPVATDATGKDEPEQDHTREPGEPPRPAQAAQDKFTGEMQPVGWDKSKTDPSNEQSRKLGFIAFIPAYALILSANTSALTSPQS